jgi:hypothetical protein
MNNGKWHSASSLAEDDKVFEEKFINTSHQKARYKLFNFTYTLKRNNKKLAYIDAILHSVTLQ